MKTKILAILLGLCLLPARIAAQQVTITSMTETTDIIAADDQRRDFNKELCALVKVQVVDGITDVEGNVMGDIINHGVEKWVYMAKGSRNMKIHLKNNLPVKVMFRDYGINGLKSNRVYVLVLEAPNKGTATGDSNAKLGNLLMHVTPVSTTLTIWGDQMQMQSFRPQDDGTLCIALPYGRYHYKASANGHHDTEGSVFVNDEDKWETVSLKAVTGRLTVTCPSPKCEISLNGSPVHKGTSSSTWTGEVTPGTYRVKVSLKGYTDVIKTIEVGSNKQATVNVGKMQTLSELKKQEKRKQRAQKALEEKKLQQQKTLARVQAQQSRINTEQEKKKREAQAAKQTKRDQQKVVWGITAGYNMASAQFSSDYDGTCSSISGFHAGLTTEFRLAKNFYLNTGLLYSAKGYEYENRNDIEESGSAQYLDIPLLLAVHLPLGKQAKLQFNAGPYLAFCIGGKVKDEWSSYSSLYDIDFSEAYSGFDYGAQFGVGLDIIHHIHLGVSYQQGMASEYQNRNLMFSLGYRF